MKTSFISRKGDPFSVSVPTPGDFPSFFVFSYVRSGSTLLDRIMRSLCSQAGIPTVHIADEAFEYGVTVPDIQADIESILYPCGYGYLGFRQFFEFEPHFDFSKPKKVFLFREPKDLLVSLYFSVRHSHPVPERGYDQEQQGGLKKKALSMDINEFVRYHSEIVYSHLHNYLKIIDQNSLVFRYEKIIFQKKTWIEQLCRYLAIDIDETSITRILEPNDIFPEREIPDQHIRQVHPDNYKQHLDSSTIGYLDSIFADLYKQLGDLN